MYKVYTSQWTSIVGIVTLLQFKFYTVTTTYIFIHLSTNKKTKQWKMYDRNRITIAISSMSTFWLKYLLPSLSPSPLPCSPFYTLLLVHLKTAILTSVVPASVKKNHTSSEYRFFFSYTIAVYVIFFFWY